MAEVTCSRCGGPLDGRADRMFCSSACRQAAYRERRRAQAVADRGEGALDWFAARLGLSRNTPTPQSRNAAGEP